MRAPTGVSTSPTAKAMAGVAVSSVVTVSAMAVTVGASFTAVTVMLIVAVSMPPCPSDTVTVKPSGPL